MTEAPRLGPGREFDLIRRLVGMPSPRLPGLELGPGDDAAVLDGGVVVSCDLTVDGVHFRRPWLSMEEVGHRAAAAALSDLAAMAAAPACVLLSMAVDPGEVEEVAPAVQTGAAQACEAAGTAILGGDLSRSPGPLVLDVVVVGRTERPLLRCGSAPGDEVWVTGWLGSSAGAVSAWKRGEAPPPYLRRAFTRPRPRIREALWLVDRGDLHAGIDLSDGLAGDAGHLAAASEVALIIDSDALPFLPELQGFLGAREDCLRHALTGGEDYELCFTAPAGTVDPLVEDFSRTFGIPLSKVGRVVEGEGVRVEGTLRGEWEVSPTGFDHFKGGEDR